MSDLIHRFAPVSLTTEFLEESCYLIAKRVSLGPSLVRIAS